MPRFFPQKAHRIKPNIPRPGLHVEKNDFDVLQQHIGVFEININLVGTEGRPHMLGALDRFYGGQQG